MLQMTHQTRRDLSVRTNREKCPKRNREWRPRSDVRHMESAIRRKDPGDTTTEPQEGTSEAEVEEDVTETDSQEPEDRLKATQPRRVATDEEMSEALKVKWTS